MTYDVSRSRHWMVGNSPVKVGRFTYGTESMSVLQWGEGAALEIGSFCSIASATIFLGGNHRADWSTTFPFGHIYADMLGGTDIKGHPATRGDVVIGSDVWLGLNTTIVSGVTIGHGAVVAANAHVAADVAPYSVVGGNPATERRQRFDPAIRDLLLELRWWELPLDFIRSIAADLSRPPTIEAIAALVERARELPRDDGA